MTKSWNVHPGKGAARMSVALILTALVAAPAVATTSPASDPGRGNDNPTLAVNLTGPNDWSPAMQFLDLTKTMRSWIGHRPGQWGGMSYGDLNRAGYLDDHGWPTAIPDELDRIGTIWAWSGQPEAAADRIGTYVVRYEGEGTLRIRGGGLTIASNEPGRIVFDKTNGNEWTMDIMETDPQGTGDYIRNISIVKEEYVALHEAGAVFNPEWLDTFADVRQIRLMDWNNTNNATIVSWDQRREPDDAIYTGGIPVELQVRVANEIGADPWFTIPHTADDDYIRQFATVVRDNLDPGLQARVEYSNEWWNWSFTQSRWLLSQSQQNWEQWSEAAYIHYYAKKATETALIWDDVFAEEADSRLVHVISGQSGNVGLTPQIFNPRHWRENEPDSYVDPKTVFDEYAITSYFGGSEVSNATLRAELLSRAAESIPDTNAWLRDRMLDPDYAGSNIPKAVDHFERHKAIVEPLGIDMVTYEGGQHVHHYFAVQGVSDEELTLLTDFMIQFVRSDEMGELYEVLWDEWAKIGDGPFMQFGEVGSAGTFGSWGLLWSLQDENPRASVLFERNATWEPWWETSAGDQYLRGTTTIADGTIGGTAKNDYLIGGDGDDVFHPGNGTDGVNGGGGVDRLVLPGTRAAHTVVIEGDGIRITGPSGSTFAVNIDEFVFDGNAVLSATEVLIQPVEVSDGDSGRSTGNDDSGQVVDDVDDEQLGGLDDDTGEPTAGRVGAIVERAVARETDDEDVTENDDDAVFGQVLSDTGAGGLGLGMIAAALVMAGYTLVAVRRDVRREGVGGRVGRHAAR